MLWDFCKKVFEVIVDIQIICFGGFNNAVQYGAGLSSMYCIDQLPVFLSNTKWPDRLFGQVVIKWYLWIIKECPQIFFLIDAVSDARCCFR